MADFVRVHVVDYIVGKQYPIVMVNILVAGHMFFVTDGIRWPVWKIHININNPCLLADHQQFLSKTGILYEYGSPSLLVYYPL